MKSNFLKSKTLLTLLTLCLSASILSACNELLPITSDVDTTSGTVPIESHTVKETPVISGVRSEIVVYEDDPTEEIMELLLDGVATVGGEPCAVEAAVFSSDGSKTETFAAGEYRIVYFCERDDVIPVESVLTVIPEDKMPPVIMGATDKDVFLGDTVSYRKGITVSDNEDKNTILEIDASKVDLTRIGEYPLTYSATDKRGNTVSVTVKVRVIERPTDNPGNPSSICTKEELDALCNKILSEILKDSMTEREKAEAIFNRVAQIKYVGTSNKETWISGAYTGLTTGRGDCFNYYAASKALLTLAGIPNYDLKRVGGTSDHYWQIAYVDGGWYHFDACPHPNGYEIKCFLLTEDEVAAYSRKAEVVRPKYYNYDRESCPYEVVKSRSSEN